MTDTPESAGFRKTPGGGPRPTGRGLGFSLLSGALLAAGLIRSELGALLSGAGLGAAVLGTLAGVLAEGRRRDRAFAADPEALRPSLSPATRDGKPELRAAFRVENRGVPLPRAPGTTAWVSCRGASRAGRTAEARVDLPAPGSSGTGDFPPSGSLPRGVYRGVAAAAVGDAFGFWISLRTLPGTLETAAFPEPGAAAAPAPPGAGGDRPDVTDRRIRGEDRFDARPYLPGDDPRRLNWKLYARFGELFVRPGDLSPPPRRTVRILVDTERPDRLDGPAGDAYLDILVSSALGHARLLEDRGFEVLLSAPGLPDAPADAPGRLLWLADLAWTEPGGAYRDAAGRNPGSEPLAVFGAPGVRERRVLLEARKAAGLATVVIVPDLPGAVPRGFWDRMVRIPEARPTKAGGFPEPGRVCRAAFREALDREVREGSRMGGVDVRIL